MADDEYERQRQRLNEEYQRQQSYVAGLAGGAGGGADYARGAEQRARAEAMSAPPPFHQPQFTTGFTHSSGGGYTHASSYPHHQQGGQANSNYAQSAHTYTPMPHVYRTGTPTAKDSSDMQWRYLWQFDLWSSVPALITIPFNPAMGLAALTCGVVGYAAAKVVSDIEALNSTGFTPQAGKPVYRAMTSITVEGPIGNHTIVHTDKNVLIKNATRALAWSGLVGKAAGAEIAYLSGASHGFTHMLMNNSPLLITLAGLAGSAYVVGRDVYCDNQGWKTAAKALLGVGVAAIGIYAGSLTAPRAATVPSVSQATTSAYVTTKRVNVHATPNGKTITQLDCGDRVNMTSPVRYGWNNVSYGWFNRGGYVWGQYLSTQQPACSP